MATFERLKDTFKNFADLASHKKEGTDYAVEVREEAKSTVAIVAPHGGSIEENTGAMAEQIAADGYNLYVFKGVGQNSLEMHLTSTHFDEPRALALVAKTQTTVTIHGCRFTEPVVYLSGRDKKLQSKLMKAFKAAGINASVTGHPYQAGKKPENICNRNQRGEGVQIEFSRGIRDNAELRDKCVQAVRDSLKAVAA
jgi:phage replication-related protein YjqB (UPF0714/DUF867 family)